MPSLNAMRQLEPEDDATSQPLGPATKPAPPVPMPSALKKTCTPGVFERNDGKLETMLPEPPKWEPRPEALKADYSELELRIIAKDIAWRRRGKSIFWQEYFQQNAYNFAAISSQKPITGRRADFIIFDDIQP